ncbi:hypothetical protein [Mycolicibacterium fluoranthenivorans]|uniref:Uncharacterized protein n=1 Tax=Mycolicibacterium fluoranthenivorans TaxID=258505 RepID=A0A7X5TYT8_9MYCO|nr:hypothetical protein [Mycolicibacterium fluoranthenivorans]MCV7357388.1 hypothetical protein [Mycolicibacterium fluoranthenivorans]NIH95229.1 hypothetical protein [Mycolicibacterium fluoranthenivorans]
MSASDETDPASKPKPESQAPVEQGVDLVAFQNFLDERQEMAEQKYAAVATSSDYPTLLSEALAHYQDVQQFSAGDFVQWKPMMRNRRFPLESVPAIVVDHIDPPLTTNAEGNRLIEPRDLLIGFIDGDQDFMLAQVPSRRFTEWKQ